MAPVEVERSWVKNTVIESILSSGRLKWSRVSRNWGKGLRSHNPKFE